MLKKSFAASRGTRRKRFSTERSSGPLFECFIDELYALYKNMIVSLQPSNYVLWEEKWFKIVLELTFTNKYSLI